MCEEKKKKHLAPVVILVRTLYGLYASKDNSKDKLRVVLHFPSAGDSRASEMRAPAASDLSLVG